MDAEEAGTNGWNEILNAAREGSSGRVGEWAYRRIGVNRPRLVGRKPRRDFRRHLKIWRARAGFEPFVPPREWPLPKTLPSRLPRLPRLPRRYAHTPTRPHAHHAPPARVRILFARVRRSISRVCWQ